MTRFVEQRVIDAGKGRLRSGAGASDDLKAFLERVAKYVPAEIVAAYVTASGFAENAKHGKVILLGIIFAVCLLCTPLYVLQLTKKPRERLVNGIVATCAFAVWAYAYGGIFRELQWYDASIASIVLVLFSVVSGAIVPLVREEPAPPALLAPAENLKEA